MRSPLIIGVAGGSGSGKTTVVRAIQASLGHGGTYLDQDSYYADLSHLSLAERHGVNFDHPDAFDTALMIEHLVRLGAGQPIEKPTYDYAAHTRAARTELVQPSEVILVDGILLFADSRLRSLFDIKIFVDVAADVRFIRRLQRDTADRGRTMDTVVGQYLTTVRPMHLEFVEPSKRYADIIIPEGGDNRIAIEMVEARVAHEIRRRRREEASPAEPPA